jgi:hypothetical protein
MHTATATYTSYMRPRYRIRTWLRGHLPGPLSDLFPKGPYDCGAHEWHRFDATTDRCYHCRVGKRAHVPTPMIVNSPEYDMLFRAAASGSEAAIEIFNKRAFETAVAFKATFDALRRAEILATPDESGPFCRVVVVDEHGVEVPDPEGDMSFPPFVAPHGAWAARPRSRRRP